MYLKTVTPIADFKENEDKWQKKWADARSFEANPSDSEKFFATFPYPYLNGPLHLGHAFTATRVDVFARYKRMNGFNVLFPFSFHATGEPIVGMAKRVKLGDEKQINVIRESGVPDSEIKKFEDPNYIVSFYRDLSQKSAQRLGFSVDWRRSFVTIDPEYNRFIEWQYAVLKENGFVGKGTHPVVWCPKDQSPTGDHDRLQGEGVSPVEFVLLKFKYKDSFLVPATLRPETIFGVTNMWLNPDAKYVKARVNNETWIVSKEAAAKLKEQLRSVDILEEFTGSKLLGEHCANPITGKSVPILPAPFVDPDNASGVVMSVPAHAPYDYMAIEDLKKAPGVLKKYGIEPEKLAPISIIKVEGFGGVPAKEMCELLGVKDQKDPRVEEATKEVYRKEFHTGVLKSECGEYAGTAVRDSKEKLSKDFKKKGIADSLWETEDLVTCRCTTKCIVKILENQWFLKYSEPKWKGLAKECLARMRIYPEDARPAFFNTIDWLQDKACARRSGLGTKLPWDKDWIVETLSDSTIYMALYTIAHKIYGKIPSEKLTREVFDYVFLGKNKEAAAKSVNPKALDEMRNEFLYWYPLDFRNSADELIFNHLTFCIFHHAGIFPKVHWPRAIGVNGMVMVEGEKMSKSKGNFITVLKSLDEWGADVTRMTLMYSAEGMDRPDWKKENAFAVKGFLGKLLDYAGTKAGSQKTDADRWLISRMQTHIKKARGAYEETRFRSALQAGFFDAMNDVRSYLKKAKPGSGFNYAVSAIIRMLAPVAPHACEEAWSLLGNKGLVSFAPFPEYDVLLVDEKLERAEELVQSLEADVENVLKLAKVKPKKISIFIAQDWKREMHSKAQGTKNPNELMKSLAPEMKKYGKDAAAFAQWLAKHSADLREAPDTKEELAVLEGARDYLSKAFHVDVAVEEAEKSKNPKARNAVPGKPAIFVE